MFEVIKGRELGTELRMEFHRQNDQAMYDLLREWFRKMHSPFGVNEDEEELIILEEEEGIYDEVEPMLSDDEEGPNDEMEPIDDEEVFHGELEPIDEEVGLYDEPGPVHVPHMEVAVEKYEQVEPELIDDLTQLRDDILIWFNDVQNDEHWPDFQRQVFEVLYAPDQVPVVDWMPHITSIRERITHHYNVHNPIFVDLQRRLSHLVVRLAPTLSQEHPGQVAAGAQNMALHSLIMVRKILFYMEGARFIDDNSVLFMQRNMTVPFSRCLGLFNCLKFFRY